MSVKVGYVPGKLNAKADALSRFSKKLNDDMEWSLNETVFNKIETKMGKCDIKISGDISEVTEFQKRLPMSSLPPGEIAQRNSMGHISKNGCTFAVKGKLVTRTNL